MTLETEQPEFDFGDDDDGAQGFFENITGKAEKAAAEATEEVAETPEGEEVVETPETEEPPVEAPETPAEDDEGEVELTYGDDKKKVSVKDIKRLMEAETSITTQTAAVTADRAAAQAVTQRAETALKSMLERAQAAFEPYSKINFLTLAKDPNVTGEVLEQLQKEAQSAYEAVQYFQTELNDVTAKAATANHAQLQKQAGEAVAVLKDVKSPNHIPNFDKPLYDGMMDFATKLGLDPVNVRAITNPAHLKLIHMAMEFQKGKTATETKVAKVIPKPTRVLKPSASSSSTTTSQRATDALTRLRRSGSEEDAADAFMASFRNKD